MTITVSKARLVAALQKKRAAIVAEHEAKVKAASREFTDYRHAVKVQAEKFLRAVDGATKVSDITDRLRYGHELRFENAPDIPKAPDTKKYDSALARLELITDAEITLNEKRDGDFLELIG